MEVLILILHLKEMTVIMFIELMFLFQKSIYKEPQESKVGISSTEFYPPFVEFYFTKLLTLTYFGCVMDSFAIRSYQLVNLY